MRASGNQDSVLGYPEKTGLEAMSRKSERKNFRKSQTKGITLDEMLQQGLITREQYEHDVSVMLMDGPEMKAYLKELNPKSGVATLLEKFEDEKPE
jgi:hypothetical protein